MRAIVLDTPPPCPARFNLARHVLDGETGGVEIVREDGVERWPRARLREACLRLGGALRARGLAPGARVALLLGDDLDFPVAFFGCIAVGLVPVPLSAQLTAAELAAMLARLRPALVLAEQGRAVPDGVAVLRESPQALAGDPVAFIDSAADDPAYILFTSGSSGVPRAVVHAHRAAWARRMMWEGWYGLRPGDRVLHAGAFNWSYTLGTGLIDPLAAGATALLIEGARDADRLSRVLAARRATLFAAVPGVYRRLLATDLPALPDLRHGLSAGEALPPALRAAWQERTGTDLHEALGMTECSTFLSSSPARPAPAGTHGYAQPGRSLAVLGEDGAPVARDTPGRLAISTGDPGLMLGYDGEAPPAGAWFVTSDLVTMAADGAFTYLGRAAEVMTAGGYRVAPLEVERVLEAHPDVHAAGVCAISPRPGLTLIAAFCRADVSPQDLAAHCEAHLARYKCPRHIQMVEALPLGATGKLLRRALPDLYLPKGPDA